MRIAVACDHIVTDRKNHVVEYLKEKGHEVIDCGTYNNERTHYAIYGKKAAEKVVGGQADLGVVLCGTGVGITASTAKVVGTRPTLVRYILSSICKETFKCQYIGVWRKNYWSRTNGEYN